MRKLILILLLAPLLALAGTVKQGNNFYRVTVAVASGSMQSTFSPLGSISIIRYTAANNAASTPYSYRSTSQFNSLTSLAAGDIVQINNTGPEVTVTALGEANVATGGAVPLVNISTTAGQASFTLAGVQFTSSTKLYKAQLEYLKPAWSYTTSGGNTTITFAAGEPGISATETNFPDFLQYQL